MDKTAVLTLLVQVVLPLVVGLVTKQSDSWKLKFGALAVLTAVNTVLVACLEGTTDVGSLILTGVAGLLVSLGTHYGIYQKTGLTEKVQDTLNKDTDVTHIDDDFDPEIPVELAGVTAVLDKDAEVYDTPDEEVENVEPTEAEDASAEATSAESE